MSDQQLDDDVQEYFALQASLKSRCEGIGELRRAFKVVEGRILEYLVKQGVTSVCCSQGSKLQVKKVVRKRPMNRNVISEVLRDVVEDSSQILGIIERMDEKREKRETYQLSTHKDKGGAKGGARGERSAIDKGDEGGALEASVLEASVLEASVLGAGASTFQEEDQ